MERLKLFYGAERSGEARGRFFLHQGEAKYIVCCSEAPSSSTLRDEAPAAFHGANMSSCLGYLGGSARAPKGPSIPWYEGYTIHWQGPSISI